MAKKNIQKLIGKSVHQHNAIIKSKRTWSAQGTKVFYMALSRLKPRLKKDFTDYSTELVVNFSKKDFEEYFGWTWKGEQIRTIADELISKNFYIDKTNEDKWKLITIFSSISYESNEGLTIEFNKHMTKYLIDLVHGNYTRIPISEIFSFKSVYAIRLFELITMVKNQGRNVVTYEINSFRELMGITPEQYTRANNIKTKVINVALKEISTKTPYYIICKNIMIGRKLIAYEFTIEIQEYYKISSVGDELIYTTKFKKEIINCMHEIKSLSNITFTHDSYRAEAVNTLKKKYGADIYKASCSMLSNDVSHK